MTQQIDKKCFGHTTEERADGTVYETCSVITHEEFLKKVKAGDCDGFDCPFFKPDSLAKSSVRIGKKIFPLVESKE